MTQLQHWSKTAQTDHVTLRPLPLTLDVCGWCGSSSSISIPSLMFVDLAVRKIWRTMCVSINRPGDLDLWPFDLEIGTRVATKMGNRPSKFEHARPLGSRILHYVRDGRTDRSNAYCPLSYGREHNKWRWWAWTIAAYRRIYGPNRLASSEGHQVNWVNCRNGCAVTSAP